MVRRVLLLAATLGAASSLHAPAHARPPYCVTMDDRDGTITYACVVGAECVAHGELGDVGWCVYWV